MTLLKKGDLKQIAEDNGWSPWTVRAVASGHRSNPEVKAAIDKKQAERLEQLSAEIKEEATTDVNPENLPK